MPPLNSIRAFEAAARHGSFVLAAEELHVTPSAVSQQIKTLEEWLQISLFKRLPRGLELTNVGKDYLPGLVEALDLIAARTADIVGKDDSNLLNVTMMPSFAAQWMVRRLEKFSNLYPDIDVRVSSLARTVDFFNEDIDLGIRYGGGNYPGLHVELLMTESVTPVCCPLLLQGDNPLNKIEDLANHTLLHDLGLINSNSPLAWKTWFEAAGYPKVKTIKGPQFSDTHLTVQAAIAGRGVMLGRDRLIADELAAGILIAPFEKKLPAEHSYYIVCKPDSISCPKVAAFKDWLVNEVALSY